MPDGRKNINGTRNNDFINPQGYGNINAGGGIDIIRINEGDHFNISGFQDSDWLQKEVVSQEKDVLQVVLPQSESNTYQVQYFERGGVTYVRLYDSECCETLASARLQGTNLNIEVLNQDISVGQRAIRIVDEEIQDQVAYEINQLTSLGSLPNEDVLIQIVKSKIQKNVDEGHNSSNPFDWLASKYYESINSKER